MKLKLKKIIIMLSIVAGVLVFAGCEPNVGTEAAGTTSIAVTPAPPRVSETTVTEPIITTQNQNEAVGINTPTAFKLSAKTVERTAVEAIVAAENSTAKIGWGLGREADDKGRPNDALAAQRKYGELGAIFIDDETENRIYLTFDEGYENGYTSEILDALKAAGIKAVFFVTYDYCKDCPELVRRMIAEGHEVGNHSYSHPSFPDISPDEARAEIQKLHDYVKEAFGYEMRLIRFPKGEFSEQVLAIAQELGYRSVFWSFAYNDWQVDSQPAPNQAFDKITTATHPGAVILLHAVSQTNAEILPSLIEFWFENGYKPALFE